MTKSTFSSDPTHTVDQQITNPAFAHSPNNLLQSLHNIQDDNAIAERVIPPLEQWQPNFCGEMDMLIKANGEWWHEGRKVTRQSLVNLFAKVLWAEIDDKNDIAYYLKTPVEKLKIQVEDAPLLITQVNQIDKAGKRYIEFVSSQGDKFLLDQAHPIHFGLPFNLVSLANGQSASIDHSQQPYVLVRKNGDSVLYGLIHRNVFYHLIEMGELIEREGNTVLTLNSGGELFELSMPNTSIT